MDGIKKSISYCGKRAPILPLGRCVFLTAESELCILHSPGLKPLEGKKLHCSSSPIASAKTHKQIAKKWDTPKGRKVAERFINEFLKD